MKYLKLFENKKIPKIGDWVIDIQGEDGIVEYVAGSLYRIRYSEHCKKIIYNAYISEIEEIGSKEEIQQILQMKKYNL